MGFKATEAVEELTYDFNPHANISGTIPEPSSKQIDRFREQVFGAMKDTGLTPDSLGEEGQKSLTFEDIDNLLEKSSEVERGLIAATAEVTGIDPGVLDSLPYRIKAAFLGWIMGEFLNPEA